MRILLASAVIAAAAVISPGFAQTGPVATACKTEIASLCSDKQHVRGEVRACLEANTTKLTQACKDALASTPGGPPRR